MDSAALNEIPLFADLTDGERAAVAASLSGVTVEPARRSPCRARMPTTGS